MLMPAVIEPTTVSIAPLSGARRSVRRVAFCMTVVDHNPIVL
jgi:hypothetical protein